MHASILIPVEPLLKKAIPHTGSCPCDILVFLSLIFGASVAVLQSLVGIWLSSISMPFISKNPTSQPSSDGRGIVLYMSRTAIASNAKLKSEKKMWHHATDHGRKKWADEAAGEVKRRNKHQELRKGEAVQRTREGRVEIKHRKELRERSRLNAERARGVRKGRKMEDLVGTQKEKADEATKHRKEKEHELQRRKRRRQTKGKRLEKNQTRRERCGERAPTLFGPPYQSGNLSEFVTTASGVQMPRLIYRIPCCPLGSSVEHLVLNAVNVGFQGIYIANEHEGEAGKALALLFTSGIAREGLFIQIQVKPNYDAETNNGVPLAKQVKLSITNSLLTLGIEYAESLILQNTLEVVDADDQNYNHQLAQILEVWVAMEDAMKTGLVRQLGISNLGSLGHLRRISKYATLRPLVVENAINSPSEHSLFLGMAGDFRRGREELTKRGRKRRAWCAAAGIHLQTFWSEMEFGADRFWRLRCPNADRELLELAQTYAITPSALILRLFIGSGAIMLTESQTEAHMRSDLSAVHVPLTVQDAEVIDGVLSCYDDLPDFLWELHPLGVEPLRSQTESATERLSVVTGLPWNAKVAHSLLRQSKESMSTLCTLHDMNDLPFKINYGYKYWTVAEARAIYEPALLHTVKTLLQARASPDGIPDDSGQTPLMYCAWEGQLTTVAALLEARSDVNRANRLGRTPLHLALIQHETLVAELLLKAGANSKVPDKFGNNPDRVARMHCLDLARCCHATPDSSERQSRRDDELGSETSAGIAVRSWQSTPPHVFVCRYYATHLPLLLRRASRKLVNVERWTRKELIKRAGESRLEVGTIPYSDIFGCSEKIQTTLTDFLQTEIHHVALSGFPYYMFTLVDDKLPLLLRMIRMELDGLPDRLPSPFQQFRTSALQFAIGGNGSGAPLHFHRDAFCILLSGQKRWWMWPPSRAAVTRLHPVKLFDTLSAEELNGGTEFLQEPGDIVYVPDSWGHAVLNLHEHTVSVSVEFDIDDEDDSD